MENKTLSRILFGVSVLLFIITFYFFYGMVANGQPDEFDPDQMGVELIEKGEASVANYKEKGLQAFDAQIEKIDSHILGGVTYLQIMLYIAGILMVVFLVWGLISTMMTNFKKAMPSLVFVGIAILAFIYAYANTGSDPSEDVRLSNFWVNGLMFVLVPGAIFLVVDLVIGIVKGYTK